MQIVTAAEPSLSAEEHAGHAHPPGKHDAAEAGHDHEGGILGPNTELIFALACGGLLASGYLIERFLAAPAWLPFAFYLSAYAFDGFFTLREAIDNLRLKRFEIDTLMLVARGRRRRPQALANDRHSFSRSAINWARFALSCSSRILTSAGSARR